MSSLPVMSLEERLRLHELARQRAEALRREALADVWRGANAALATAGTQALRAAQRLAHRLARRAAQRAAAEDAAGDAAAAGARRPADAQALRALERVLG